MSLEEIAGTLNILFQQFFYGMSEGGLSEGCDSYDTCISC